VRLDDPGLRDAVLAATGRNPTGLSPLTGGCIAQVYKIEVDGGEPLVAKVAPEGGLALEGEMLAYLARESALPVPAVLHGGDNLLLIEFVANDGGLTASAEVHGAELLAALHGITAPAFGFHKDTLIGPLRQPNPWCQGWLELFVEHRLLYMGRIAEGSGHLPDGTLGRVERLCAKFDRYIEGPPQACLIHGDIWAGNVLTRDGRIAAFVDPAIYFADPEIELAYASLFNTFGEPFFARYQELRPIAPGFHEARRDLYTLYPLLVHTALFGGPYGSSVAAIVGRYL
jgi:fructosamine-3-kinase